MAKSKTQPTTKKGRIKPAATWRLGTDCKKKSERVCPCGQHILTAKHQTKYANKGCQMRVYHRTRAERAARGEVAPEKGRGKAQAPTKALAPARTPVATQVAVQAFVEAPHSASPARLVEAPSPIECSVQVPAAGHDDEADEVSAVADAPDPPASTKPVRVGRLADAVRALLGLPANRLLTYVRPGVIPTWCRRGRWRGGWRLTSDKRTFLGRNVNTIRAAVEGFAHDAISGRLTAKNGDPLPGATLATVRVCRGELSQARHALNLPTQVVAEITQFVPHASRGHGDEEWAGARAHVAVRP